MVGPMPKWREWVLKFWCNTGCMLDKKFPFQQIFASVIKPVVSEEKDQMLALASVQELAALVPDVDISRNYDLLPIAFDACVANRVNRNHDLVDTDTALAIYKTFLHKFIDAEHDRKRVIGVIVSAYLTEFGTNKRLTEDDVRGRDIPFNITLGGVLWRAVNEKLCDLVEEAADPTSDFFMKVSASWEIGFSGYSIVELAQGDKNLSQGHVITNPETIKEVKKYLKCYGGSGVMKGKGYYRMPNVDVIAMGVGLTEKPAADVKGVMVKLDAEPEASIPVEAADEVAEASDQKVEVTQNIISQSQENNVKRERRAMKITSINDITDENLKQCTASVITDFINAELKKASDQFVAEKQAQASLADKFKESTENLAKQLTEVKASLDSLQKEKENRDKVDAFNARMSEVFASYELPEDVAKVIVEDIKAIANEEAFASWKTKAATLLKAYDKQALAAAKKADEEAKAAKAKAEEMEAKAKAEAKAKEDSEKAEKDKKDNEDKEKKGAKGCSKASEEAVASAVETAVDNAETKDKGLPNTTSASAPSLKEKFAQAFAEENFVIKK